MTVKWIVCLAISEGPHRLTERDDSCDLVVVLRDMNVFCPIVYKYTILPYNSDVLLCYRSINSCKVRLH